MAVQLNAGTSNGYSMSSDTSGILQLQTAGTTAVTVDASQNVGIGTTSPSWKIDVVTSGTSGIRATTADYGMIQATNGTVVTKIQNGGTVGILGTDTNHALALQTNNAERMRIDASGNLLVGTTTSLGKVTFTGASSSDLLVLNTTATSGTATAIVYKDGALDVCGYVSMNATANTVTYVNSSDSRLKTNPRDFSGIDIVKEIKPKKYERLSNLGVDEIGLYAQELNEVFPEAVAVGDEDVTVKPWGIDYGRITPVLVKAIQEQQQIITDLKATVDSHVAIINDLKARITALEGAK